MKVLQEKLEFLLNKYSVGTKAVLADEKTVVVGGETLPLLPHRSERRFIELKNIVNGGTLEGVSVMRTFHITQTGADLYEVLTREMDICRFVLQRELVSVMVMENGNVLNAIATCTDGVVCTIEISATLPAGEQDKEKHEIIAQRGTACDVVVDAQLRQDSIYVYGAENQKYTDVDFELYGLSVEQVAIVRAAFELAQKGSLQDRKATGETLQKLTQMAKRSAQTGEREVM